MCSKICSALLGTYGRCVLSLAACSCSIAAWRVGACGAWSASRVSDRISVGVVVSGGADGGVWAAANVGTDITATIVSSFSIPSAYTPQRHEVCAVLCQTHLLRITS